MDISTIAMYLCIGSFTIMAMITIRPIIVWFIEDIKESIKRQRLSMSRYKYIAYTCYSFWNDSNVRIYGIDSRHSYIGGII